MPFFHKLFTHSRGSLLCVGLDTDLEKIPTWFKQRQIDLLNRGQIPKISPGEDGVLEMHAYIAQHEHITEGILNAFNALVINETHGLAMCYKLNLGFYLNQYTAGLQALRYTVQYAHEREVPVILDGKFGDIGSSSEQYAHFAYEVIGADAVTVEPYLGHGDALEPFLRRSDKGVFVLCHTSNKGADEFQHARVLDDENRGYAIGGPSLALYERVAERVVRYWNANGNCGLVTGATFPGELAKVRQLVGDDVSLLVPGLGKQEGELEASVRGGVNSRGEGAVFNVSRDIVFASTGEDMFQTARAKAEWYNREIRRCTELAMA